MPAERFDFPNAKGEKLAAVLDLPAGAPRAYALFAHCFTCGKNVLAAKRIAEALNALGIAVLRFDFTGIGSSEGEFANTTFSSNVADLVAAADHLRKTAAGAGAADRPQPRRRRGAGGGGGGRGGEGGGDHRRAQRSRPCHASVRGQARRHRRARRGRGRARRPAVPHPPRIPGTTSPQQKLTERIAQLRKALLIFHSPTDDTVGIENAAHIFARRQASQELHLARRRRSSAHQAQRRGLCRERAGGLGRALSRRGADAGGERRGAAHGGRHRNRRRKIPADGRRSARIG